MLNGYYFILLAAMGYATLPILNKVGYQLNMTMDILLTLRFFIATIILFVIMIVTRKHNLTLVKGQLPRLIVQGLLFFGCAYCYTSAVKYLAASITSILLYAYPAMVVMIMTLFFHEKIDIRKITALILSFLGCLMVINIFNDHFQFNWIGIAFGLGAALLYALYNINGQYLTAKLEPMAISAFVMLVCSIATAIVYPPTNLVISNLGVSSWLVGLGTAVLCSVIPTIFYLKGISVLGASRSAIVSTIEPAFTILLAGVILGEILTITQLFGGLLIIAGVLILQIKKQPGKYSYSVNTPQL